MAGIVKFDYEKNQKVLERSTLISFKITKIDDSNLLISISTTAKKYKFNISSDNRWQNDLEMIIKYLDSHFIDVLNGSIDCEIEITKEPLYVFFRFDGVDVLGKFTGKYVE